MLLGSMVSGTTIFLFHAFLCLQLYPAVSQTWIKAGYWLSGRELSSRDINSALYTHLICAFAGLDSSSYHLSISTSDDESFAAFTDAVKQKNPSVTTLLSIGGADYSTFTRMVSNSSNRNSFIEDSIKIARHYGFQGLDFSWVYANTSDNMADMGTLFQEWRAAAASETRNSSQSELILTAAVQYSPRFGSTSWPIDSIKRNLNWVHVLAYDYYLPTRDKFTGPFAALYDPNRNVNTDYGIAAWINGGLLANKLVLALPFNGYAWTLANPKDRAIGAPATGPAITGSGWMSYKDVKNYIKTYGAEMMYNSTYIVNYCTVGSSWVGFDDVEVVITKVSYAKEKELLGYVVWEVSFDDNWELSTAAQAEVHKRQPKRRLAVIVLTSTAAVILLLCFVFIYYIRLRMLKSKGKEKKFKADDMASAGDFNRNVPDLIVYSFVDIENAKDRFSFENKLGEGGYGPVYKGVLPGGQEIAVKKLSKTSTQGFEEFENEVMLTAKLQHVNLLRVLGFCVEREGQMLIYEYMPNKNLEYYLFDPIRRYMLHWTKRLEIIEGITQGLLYLQEYSRLTVIHRDLKPSNILLDNEMKARISDFGMARIFTKDGQEANTGRIMGTYGYVPPEYVRNGVYSTKSDVYSFGVLLLQIISGKKNACSYGPNENLSLLDYAYELWKDGKGLELMDPSLDDTSSSCKLITCMQIALLCVQENPIDRPSMLEVSSMLKNETAVVMIPKRPAFSTQKNENENENQATVDLEFGSVNDVTISEVVGR